MTKSAILAGVLIVAGLAGAAEAAAPGKYDAAYKQPARAQQTPGAAQPRKPPPPGVAPAAPVAPLPPFPTTEDDRGARETRDRLRKLLDQYPPSVRQVLRIDTSLLSRPDYLATYPALAAFLAQHPEVVHNPAYFVGDASGVFTDGRPPDSTSEAIRAWRNFTDDAMAIGIVSVITFALAGIIRTLLEQRRWQRAARIQVDMQNKLIDRFSGGDELLTYLQSPAGRGLADLQAAGAGAAVRGSLAAMSLDAPLGRILWSLQTGVVLAAAGTGLFFVGERFGDGISQPLSGLGIIALAVGLGFIISAGVSYFISHRLGLVVPATPPDFRREAPGA
jgi:hypothetical protein